MNRADAKFTDNRYSRPVVTFGAAAHPTRTELEGLHHEAHDACYLSNSVRTEIKVEPIGFEA